MTAKPRTIHVEPGSELDRALDEAGEAPLELEQRGVRYHVIRVDVPAESQPRPADAGDDSVLTMIGLGSSPDPTSIAQHEQEYLADAINPARHP